jgi:hypothetical protein
LVVLFELAIVLLCFVTNVFSTLIIYCSGRISNLKAIGAFSANFVAICMFDLTVHLFWLFFDVSFLFLVSLGMDDGERIMKVCGTLFLRFWDIIFERKTLFRSGNGDK